MDEDTNRKVLAAVADADNRHDTSSYAEWFSPDVVVHLLGDDVLHGLDAYTAFIEGMFVGMPDYHGVVKHRVCEGDTVVHHWTLTGTQTGPLFGMEPTGRAVNYRGASVFRLRDAKITEAWLYPDRGTMQRQLAGG